MENDLSKINEQINMGKLSYLFKSITRQKMDLMDLEDYNNDFYEVESEIHNSKHYASKKFYKPICLMFDNG